MINVYASKIPMQWVSTKTGDKIKFLEFKNAKDPKGTIHFGLRQTRPEGYELSSNFDAAMIEAIKAKGGIKTNMIVVKGVETKYTGGKLWMVLKPGCEIIVLDAIAKTPKFRKVVEGQDGIKAAEIDEDWNPSDAYTGTILHDAKDLKDESTVQQFVEFTGLPKLVVDIWKYAKTNLNQYPSKITNRGMVYSAPNSSKVELEFTKDGKVNLWKFKIGMNKENAIESKLMRVAAFNYKEFKSMLDSDFRTESLKEVVRKEIQKALKEYGAETMYFANPGGTEQIQIGKTAPAAHRFYNVDKWKDTALSLGAVITDRGDDWLAMRTDDTKLGTFNKMTNIGTLEM